MTELTTVTANNVREMYCSFYVYKIESIDTKNQTFRCDLRAEFKWKLKDEEDTLLDEYVKRTNAMAEKKYLTEAQVKESALTWVPDVIITNSLEIYQNDDVHGKWYTFDHENKTATFKWHISGLFHEAFELADFPFDMQDLKVVFSTKHYLHKAKFQIDEPWAKRITETYVADVAAKGSDKVELGVNVKQRDFAITEFSNVTSCGVVYESVLGMANHYSFFVVNTLVRRNSFFYLMNILLPMFVISSLSFATVQIPVHEVADRLAVNVTLLLTSVSFKTFISTYIPVVSYLTWLDDYVLSSFFILALIIVENGIASIHPDIDHSLYLAILILWAAINGVLLFFFFYKVWKNFLRARMAKSMGINGCCLSCDHTVCVSRRKLDSTISRVSLV